MELVKITNEGYDLVTVEGGKEVGGSRTEQELLNEGYALAVTTDKQIGDATCAWQEISNGYVQVWQGNPDNMGE